MTETDFTWLRAFLHQRSGLALTPEKRYLVDSRLSMLARKLGLADIPELIQGLRAGRSDWASATVEAMTTNETLFFRDTLPFTQFREIMLPALREARARDRRLRIWCAACSTGQEPYSLAMILDGMAPAWAGWSIEILATDIAQDVLERARAGSYSQFEVQRGLPIQNLLKHFAQVGDRWVLDERIRSMVRFQPVNLIEDQPRLGQFDIILCRNVMIYFDMPTKAKVLASLARRLRPDGFLSLGAAETVIGLTAEFGMDREHRGLYRPLGGAPQAAASPIPAPVPRPAPAATLPPRPLPRETGFTADRRKA